jgi:hypothetical protein
VGEECGVTSRHSYSAELGESLMELKRRSERSYESIGRRVNLSKSAVHRLCAGQSVPPEFGRVEQVARACGAGSADIERLFTLWRQALAENAKSAESTESTDTADGAQAPARSAPVSRETSATAVAEAPAAPVRALPLPRPTARRRRSLTAVAALAVVLLAVTAASQGRHPAAPRTSNTAAAQQISGPAWSLPAQPVPSTLFGVTVNSSTGLMPSFAVGAVRLWDSGTRWADLEPDPGRFSWTVLDRLVSAAGAAQHPVLFVLGGTPAWANPTAPAAPYPDGSRAAPPTDLGRWDAYVSALVNRYHGRIEGYELWPLANDKRYYNGPVSTLVDMTKRAAGIIRAADPKATVVCPGMGNLWTADGRKVLAEFARDGGYDYCDVASVKLYQRTASDPPETMLTLANTVDQLMHSSGVQPRLWSTGTTYAITLQAPLSQQTAVDYAVRFYLVGIYARNLNLERMYFYNWGSGKIPLVLQAAGGEPTAAALAVEQLERWLAHAQSLSCGNGLAIGLPDHVWQCDFRITDPDRTYEASIRWTDTGIATTTVEPDMVAVRRLDGSRTALRAGDPLTVTGEAVLIERR